MRRACTTFQACDLLLCHWPHIFFHKAITSESSAIVSVVWTVAPARTPAAKNSVRQVSLSSSAFVKENTLPLLPAHHLREQRKLRDIHLLTRECDTETHLNKETGN